MSSCSAHFPPATKLLGENMYFGIYVHTQGPGGLLKTVCNEISSELEKKFAPRVLSEADGLFVDFFSTSAFEVGLRVIKKRTKRNYTMKLIGGGTIYYACLVEIYVELPDAVVIETNTAKGMRAYIKTVLMEVAPKLLKGFPIEDLKIFEENIRRMV